jgi:hypothetical protein
VTRDVDFNDAFAFDEVEVREDGFRFSDARFAEMALEHAAGNEDEHAFFDAAHDEAEWDARFGAAARAAGGGRRRPGDGVPRRGRARAFSARPRDDAR